MTAGDCGNASRAFGEVRNGGELNVRWRVRLTERCFADVAQAAIFACAAAPDVFVERLDFVDPGFVVGRPKPAR